MEARTRLNDQTCTPYGWEIACIQMSLYVILGNVQ